MNIKVIVGYIFTGLAIFSMLSTGLESTNELITFYGNLIIANIYFASI